MSTKRTPWRVWEPRYVTDARMSYRRKIAWNNVKLALRYWLKSLMNRWDGKGQWR